VHNPYIGGVEQSGIGQEQIRNIDRQNIPKSLRIGTLKRIIFHIYWAEMGKEYLPSSETQIIVRGLPSHAHSARRLCEETRKVCHTNLPQSNVNGIIGNNGANLKKLKSISGADVYIDKDYSNKMSKEVSVEITGTNSRNPAIVTELGHWRTQTPKVKVQSPNGRHTIRVRE